MSYAPNFFYQRKELGLAHLLDTYNIAIRRVKDFLETSEKKFTLKFSQNQEISLGAQSIF